MAESTGSASRQRLILDDRRELLISGVLDVESFDDKRVELNTSLGGIDISGNELKIAVLNLDEGKITISGQIDSLAYVQSRTERSVKHRSKNMLNRLMK